MRGAVAALAFLSLASCGGGDEANPIATYPYPADGGFDQALFGGVLVREGDCLYVDGPAGEWRYFLAFPEGAAEWDDGLLVTAQGAYREGEIVTFGGGEGWLDAMEWAAPPAQECDLSNVWRASGLLLSPDAS